MPLLPSSETEQHMSWAESQCFVRDQYEDNDEHCPPMNERSAES